MIDVCIRDGTEPLLDATCRSTSRSPPQSAPKTAFGAFKIKCRQPGEAPPTPGSASRFLIIKM